MSNNLFNPPRYDNNYSRAAPSSRYQLPWDNLAHNISTHMKLPQVPLPEYGRREGESLEGFLGNFETIINKYSLSEFEKFVLLSRQLRNEPLVLIKSLQGSQQSYTEAKNLLILAFSSPLTQKFDIIERMAKIKLKEGADPYSFISEMRIITHTFQTLNININTVLQYFFWNGMHEKLKTQFVHITNCNRPSLKQLQEKIFQAVERYQTLDKYSAPTELVHGYAADVRYNSRPSQAAEGQQQSQAQSTDRGKQPRACNLCAKVDNTIFHPIFKCGRFKTAKEKVEQLKRLNYCIRCANSGHSTGDCKFNFFKNCVHCKGKHFSFLCLSRSKQDIRQREAIENKTVCINYDIFATNVTNSSILPTFTSHLPDGKMIRILRDTGAQASFIRRDLAIKHKLKVLREINLTLNGFNTSANFDTYVVEVKLKIGDETHCIEVMCVPCISTKLLLPGLSIVAKTIVKKGYKLADEMLVSGDTIADLDMVLGVNALYCLPESNVPFGLKGMYSETSIGMMLFGDLKNLAENLDYLPSVDDDQNFSYRPNEISSMKSCTGSECLDINTASVHVSVADSNEELDDSELLKAVDSLLYSSDSDILNERCVNYLNYDCLDPADAVYETNNNLVQYSLDNVDRAADGRLIMNLLWDNNLVKSLSKNFQLSSQILKSNIKKLSANRDKLLMVDEVFREQVKLGIITEIDDLQDYMVEHPECSFLGHMPVFKLKNKTTKCRVVYLSNIAQKENGSQISHNMAMHPGPPINRKIATAVTLMRFDRKLLIYDIVKAFLAIQLHPEDSEKLCFLWVRDAAGGDFSVVGYQTNRLMFGLRCSPTILMLALYYILVVDTTHDLPKLSQLKKSMYNLLYMDNGAIGADTTEDLLWAFKELPNIFSPYKIDLQQFLSNDPAVQRLIAGDSGDELDAEQKLLGMIWNVVSDELTTEKFQLDRKADTKRKVLSSIASNYDIFAINGPLLNRARLFMNSLQTQPKLGWDQKISDDDNKLWHNICNQVNSSPRFSIQRFIGTKETEYELHVYTDSSKVMYGAVVYIYCKESSKYHFITGKNKVIGSKLNSKSIPSLELHGVVYGAETVLDVYNELCSDLCVLPLKINKIRLFSDSLVVLNWVQSFASKANKMNKTSAFVLNRLENLMKLCETKSIEFNYVAGQQNPADAITRAMSPTMFAKTNYLRGLTSEELASVENGDFPKVVVPAPIGTLSISCNTVTDSHCIVEPLVDITRYSNFTRALKVQYRVMWFINNLKSKLLVRNQSKYSHLTVLPDKALYDAAQRHLIKMDQIACFPDIFSYLDGKKKTLKSIPHLVSQLNVFRDSFGCLRVKSKMLKWHEKLKNSDYPFLLSKSSTLAKLAVLSTHSKLAHSGLYSTLREVRKTFWIINAFSFVKKTLKECTHCRRFNNRTCKLSQSPYRDFRISPSNVPFRQIFIDHLGPITVSTSSGNVKIYILVLTCLWSRAINLQVCRDLTTDEFLRAFQSHIFKYGVPQFCSSDLGSSIVQGTKLLTEMMSQPDVTEFLNEHDIESVKFTQYPKGCSSLGGLVETCVKMTKRLLFGSIKNNIIPFYDFCFLTERVNSLVNKRPICFKSALRSNNANEFIPTPITPESLIYGREISSVAILPCLRSNADLKDLPFGDNLLSHIKESDIKLNKCHRSLIDLYNGEFLQTLAIQATDKGGRYNPIATENLAVGDLVLLKEVHCKPGNYPLGIVKTLVQNVLDEVTEVTVMKGRTREVVRRHVTSLIPLLRQSEYSTEVPMETKAPVAKPENVRKQPIRKAATKCKANLTKLAEEHLT